jgi:hypothetical protein
MLSNGNIGLLTNMAKRAGLPWDCILSAEVFRAYKRNGPYCLDRNWISLSDLCDNVERQEQMMKRKRRTHKL